MSHSPEFGISNANEFFNEIVRPQHEDFLKNNASRRHALLTIMVAYHMFEWVHPKVQFSKGKPFKWHFASEYPNDVGLAKTFDLAREIANGTKHCKQKTQTRRQPGFSPGFSDEFARPLVVIYPDGMEHSVDVFLRQMVTFWAKEFPQTV